MNQPGDVSLKTKLRAIIIIHLALLCGMVLFAALAYFITGSAMIRYDTKEVFLLVVPVTAVVGFLAGGLLYKKQLAGTITSPQNLSGKLTGYQTASIIRYALLEGPALFGITSYIVSHNFLYMIISVIIILYFLAIRPTKTNIADSLELGYDDRAELETV